MVTMERSGNGNGCAASTCETGIARPSPRSNRTLSSATGTPLIAMPVTPTISASLKRFLMANWAPPGVFFRLPKVYSFLRRRLGIIIVGYHFLRRPRRFLWGSQSWLLPEQLFEPSGYPLIVFLPPIRDEKDPAERKQHASGCAGRVVRPERFEVIGRESFAASIGFENLQEGPQSGAPVPLDDGLRIRQDVEILGDPKVQARGGGGQHVVVKLHFAMVPFAHFSRREPAAPLGRSGQLAHEPVGQRIDVSGNLNSQRASGRHAREKPRIDGRVIVDPLQGGIGEHCIELAIAARGPFGNIAGDPTLAGGGGRRPRAPPPLPHHPPPRARRPPGPLRKSPAPPNVGGRPRPPPPRSPPPTCPPG